MRSTSPSLRSGVSQQLIELFGVGSMRAFDLAIELRRIWFDIGVSDTLVLNMPVELAWNSWPLSVRTSRILNGTWR